MKILNDVKEIFAKRELKPIELPDGFNNVYDYLRAFPDERNKFIPQKHDTDLFQKYRSHIPDGWYGFDVGTPIVPEWMEILDEVVELCTMVDPTFEIHQIKLKFGGIRFYVSSEIIEDINEVESLIDTTLYDRALIY